MLKAVTHLHSQNIIHRDIKLENFLVGENLEQIRLIDFGLASKYDPSSPPSLICGTMISAAPEMHCKSNYDLKIDCWSLGIVLFEMLCNDLPFGSNCPQEYKNHILNSKIDFSKYQPLTLASKEALDLLGKLLEKDPVKRISSS